MKRYLLLAPAVILLAGCVVAPYDPYYYNAPVAYPAQPVYVQPYSSFYFGYGGGWGGGGRGHWRR